MRRTDLMTNAERIARAWVDRYSSSLERQMIAAGIGGLGEVDEDVAEEMRELARKVADATGARS